MTIGVIIVQSDLFPTIFHIAQEKEAWVGEVMVCYGDQIYWHVNISRSAQNWKIDNFKSFFSSLYFVTPRIQDSDTLWWILTSKGLFSIHSYYKTLTRIQRVKTLNSRERKFYATKYPWKLVFFLLRQCLLRISWQWITCKNLGSSSLIGVACIRKGNRRSPPFALQGC